MCLLTFLPYEFNLFLIHYVIFHEVSSTATLSFQKTTSRVTATSVLSKSIFPICHIFIRGFERNPETHCTSYIYVMTALGKEECISQTRTMWIKNEGKSHKHHWFKTYTNELPSPTAHTKTQNEVHSHNIWQ